MKSLLVLLVSALFGIGISACGSSSADTKGAATISGGSTSATSGHGLIRAKDRDNDEDNNDDDQHVLGFGEVPNAAESQAMSVLVKRYLAAAAAGDGKEGCALLTPFVAEAVAEEDGQMPGLRGTTCAAVMSKLFEMHHQELVGKSAALKIMRIGVEGDKSLVALEFPEIPVVHQITLRRDNGKWTVLTLLDGTIE